MKSKENGELEKVVFPHKLITEEFEVSVNFLSSGKKIQTERNKDGISLSFNTDKFNSEEDVQREALIQTGYHKALQEALANNPKAFLAAAKKNPGLLKGLSYQGVTYFKNKDNVVENILKHKPEFDNLADEFKWACQYYVLNEAFPEDISVEVKKAIKKLPKKGGKLPLDYISSDGTSLKIKGKMYDKYIQPQLDKLSEIKVDSDNTEKDDYVPPLDSDSENLSEGQIENKVYPFWGGYYRGQVFTFDTKQRKLVAPSVTKYKFSPKSLSDGVENHKTYTFKGVFDPEKTENILHLPHKEGEIALPISTTLTPQSEFKIMRDERGTFSLETKNKILNKKPFEFEFILLTTNDNKLNDAPVDENLEISQDSKPQIVVDFLENIKAKTHLSKEDKIQMCLSFVRKNLRYPEPEEFPAMNKKYGTAGENLFSEIISHGITDCHWGNIFFGELLKNLGLPHRMPAGFYVEKDPRFDFAALAGTGHTWSEVWNDKEWIRYDGTPSKQNDEEPEDSDEESEDQDGDFSETPEEQEELTLEEIEDMYDDLIKENSEEEEEEEENIAEELFEEQKGVELSRWREVEEFINQVNKTPIDSKWSVSGKPSTLQEEWKNLFDLIYKKREAPLIKFRGPVRQSEGDSLDDPVDAYIDIKSGESDPLGFKVEETKIKESIDVTEFEDDSILDLTVSMSGTPVLEQKKMILSAGFNLMQLNRKINLSSYRNKLKTPIRLKSRVASFQGNSDTSLHHASEQEIDEKALTYMYKSLDNMKSGAGDLKKALNEYRDNLDEETLKKIKDNNLIKVLTIITDGRVGGRAEAIRIIKDLRSKGIIIQGIGFGLAAQDIRVICNDNKYPNSGVVLTDVSQAVLVRHAMLANHLKNI